MNASSIPFTQMNFSPEARPSDPKLAGDRVMAGLIKVTAPEVKGAHDADLAIVDDRAYIVAEVNDVQGGESSSWSFIYVVLSVVNLATGEVERIIPFARSGQVFANVTLPEGACFVPRLLRKDANTLRCYFVSESPGNRESQTWIIDFDLVSQTFGNEIHEAKIQTAAGVFPMQPRYFYEDAVRHGFALPQKDSGLYLVDSFKPFDGKIYAAVNNFQTAQNGFAVLNDALDTFEVLGHFNEPQSIRLTESAVTQLPDKTWLAICRQDGGDKRYYFTTSADGRQWTVGAPREVVPNGGSSKPTLDYFNGRYYLGWQDREEINGASRSIFNLDVSPDGVQWTRRYRFESERSFQYPMFKEDGGRIYVAVTQGDDDPSRKERIMFGRLE